MMTGPDDVPVFLTREEYKIWLSSHYGKAEMESEYEDTDSINVPWWRRFLNPTFRRWIYGVSVAATGVLAGILEKPEIVPLMLPLFLALFFVDSNGESK